MPPSPRAIRILTGLLSGLIFLIGLGGSAVCFLAVDSVLWGALAFQAILVVSGILGLVQARGVFDRGFGIAAASIGGSVVGAALFGSLDLGTNLKAAAPDLARGVQLGMFAAMGLGAMIAGLGGLVVLLRKPSEMRRLVAGVLLGLPVVGLLAGAATRSIPFLFSRQEGNVELVRMTLLFIVGAGAIACVSAAGHLVITAFARTSASAKEVKGAAN